MKTKNTGKSNLKKRTFVFIILCCVLYLFFKLIVYLKGVVFFDEGVYVGIAKYLASFGKIGYFESIRPLALSFLLIPLQLIPLNSLITGRIFGMILTIAAIPVIYYTTKKNFNQKAALWATLFFSASISILIYGGYILTDIPAYTLALLGCFLTINKKYFLAGIATGAGFLFRFPAIMVVLPILFYIIIKEKKISKCVEFGIGVLFVSAPYFLFNFFHYTGDFFSRVIGPLINASFHIENPTWVYEKAGISRYLFSIITTDALVLFFSTIGVKNMLKSKKKDYLLFLSCVVIFFLYFSLRIPRYDMRYMLSVIIFLFPFAGYGAYTTTKKYKKVLPWLILLVVLQGIVFSVGYASISKKIHDETIENLINDYPNHSIVTNSGLPLLYLNTKSYMLPGPNLGNTYLTYQKDKDSQWFILDPACYPCPKNDIFCFDEFNERLSYMLSNNNIIDCSYLHGTKLIILTKGEQKISKRDCLKKIDYNDLPNAEKNVFIRLNAAIFTLEGEIQNIEGLSIVVESIKTNNLPATLVLVSTNVNINNKSINLLRDLEGFEIGVMPSENINTVDFINKIEKLTNKKVTSIVPKDDDWIKKEIKISKGINSTITGSWDTTIIPIKRKEIDLYILKDWDKAELYETDYLKNTYTLISKGDNEIGVDIPVCALTSGNLEKIISLVDHIGNFS